MPEFLRPARLSFLALSLGVLAHAGGQGMVGIHAQNGVGYGWQVELLKNPEKGAKGAAVLTVQLNKEDPSDPNRRVTTETSDKTAKDLRGQSFKVVEGNHFTLFLETSGYFGGACYQVFRIKDSTGKYADFRAEWDGSKMKMEFQKPGAGDKMAVPASDVVTVASPLDTPRAKPAITYTTPANAKNTTSVPNIYLNLKAFR
jgi:hypothetical protein